MAKYKTGQLAVVGDLVILRGRISSISNSEEFQNVEIEVQAQPSHVVARYIVHSGSLEMAAVEPPKHIPITDWGLKI